MPIISKYSNKKIEQILDDMYDVFEKHQANPELALMIVGDLATNILNSDVPKANRKIIAEKFAQALLTTIKED